MKFFIVSLAVIAIESIGNCVGQATESGGYKYDFDVFRDEMATSPNEYIKLPGSEINDQTGQIFIVNDITGDELKFVATLKRGDEVVYSIPLDKRASLCDDTPLAKLIRGTLTPLIETSTCPIAKGDYYISNYQRLSFTNPKQLTCGEYTGTADVLSTDSHVIEIAFNYELNPEDDDCKPA